MTEATPVFLVSSSSEAGQVEAAGHVAVTCGTKDAGEIASMCVAHSKDGTPLVSLLSDEDSREVAEACEIAGGVFVAVDQWRTADAFLGGAVAELCDQVAADIARDLENRRAEVQMKRLKRRGVYHVADVTTKLASGEADREPIPTGLKLLDDALDGGLPVGGLVTLGAISSTGKTTLAVQCADNMAASGRPVLFVSIEQGRYELVAKSISRIMRATAREAGGWCNVSANDLQRASRRAAWNEKTRKAYSSACTEYLRTVAPRMRVMELDGQPTVAQIREAAEIIRDQEGAAPCVFVDYLQLVAPAHDRMTERQAIDKNISDLRTLGRDLRTCVFAISSLNRASYADGVTQESFKESGLVEYSSDVLLGLQPRGMGEKLEDVKQDEQRRTAKRSLKEYKRQVVREAEIVILKNRGCWVPGDPVPLVYDAAGNLFVCDPAPSRPPEKQRRVR